MATMAILVTMKMYLSNNENRRLNEEILLLRRELEEQAHFNQQPGNDSMEQRVLELEREHDTLEEELRIARCLPTTLRERAETSEKETQKIATHYSTTSWQTLQ